MYIRSLVSEFCRNIEIFSFPDVLFTDFSCLAQPGVGNWLEVIIDLLTAHTPDHDSVCSEHRPDTTSLQSSTVQHRLLLQSELAVKIARWICVLRSCNWQLNYVLRKI